MILERLTLKNFRSYLDAEVAFEPGVTLFEGDIGSGKSSLLFAVEFALFGLADVPGEHLLRAGEKEGLIELTFRSAGRACVVGRRLVRSKAGGTQQKDAYLVVAGEKEDLSVEQLRAAVIKLLGFREQASTKSKSQIFRYGVFTPQEEMKAILEGGAEERKQTLRRAFGIEEYKRARESADLVKAALRERTAAFELVLQGAPQLSQERALALRQSQALALQLEEAKLGQAAAAKERARAKERLVEAEALESRARELETALAANREESAKQEERREGAKRALEELERVGHDVAALRPKVDGLADIERELALAEAREEERRRLSDVLARAESALKGLETRKEEIARESEDIRKVTGGSEGTLAGKAQLDELRRALEQVKEETAAAREAAQAEAEGRKRLAALEEEAHREGPLREKIGALEAAEVSGRAAEASLKELEEKRRQGQESQGALRGAVERTEKELEDITALKGKAKCPKCAQPLDGAHLESHRRELEAALAGCRRGLASAQGQARALEKAARALSLERDGGQGAARERSGLQVALERSLKARAEAKALSGQVESAHERAARAQELALARRTLEAEIGRKAHFEAKAAELEVAKRRWREVSDQLQRVRREVEETAGKARDLRTKLEALGGEAQALKPLRERVASAREALARLKELERRLQARGDFERRALEAKAALAEVSARKAGLEGEKEALSRRLDEAPLARVRSAAEAAALKEAAFSERLKSLAEGVSVQREALAQATARLAKAEAAEADLARARHARDFLEQCFQPALEEVEVGVLTDLNGQLNERFQTYFARLMEGAPVEVEIDPEFEPRVTQGQNSLPLPALSGGERTSVALAYRLALNMLVSRAAGQESPDLLILDEPTDGFSKEQLSRVGELLRDLDCEQVVLVSHERELESCADLVFEVVKDGTVSRIEAR